MFCKQVHFVSLLAWVALVSAACSDNDESSCGKCNVIGNGKCELITKSCEGMEDHCEGMEMCSMVGGVCVEKSNPCTSAKYCGECEWNPAISVCTEVSGQLGNHVPDHVPSPPPPAPSDRMDVTFFAGKRVVVLWDELDVDSEAVYAACVFVTGLLACTAQMSMHYIEHSKMHLALKMGAKLINLVISNFVMLILMISNVGLFVAVTVGSTIGFGLNSYFFPHHKKSVTNFNSSVRNGIQDFTYDTTNQDDNNNFGYQELQPASPISPSSASPRYAASVGRI